MLPRHARCVLSRLRCKGHGLLLGYLSRIGRIENPSCSTCGHLSSHSALSSYGLFVSTISGPDPGELPGFWGSMVSRHASIPRKGSGKQQQNRLVHFVGFATGKKSKSNFHCLSPTSVFQLTFTGTSKIYR